jgi:hypothetical protein
VTEAGGQASLRWTNRAVAAWRTGSAVAAVVALVVANAIPIIGVALFDWSLMTILVLYWIENGVVGLWNLPKIALAEAPAAGAGARATLNRRPLAGLSIPAQRSFAMPFFAFHYGIFWVVHGVFVFLMPVLVGVAGFGERFEEGFGFEVVPPGAGATWEPGTLPFAGPGGEPAFPADFFGGIADGSGLGAIELGPVLLGAVVLFVSHGVSFFWNYVAQGEYRRTSPVERMFAPYGRVVVLHVAIVLGAMPVLLLGSPIGLLVVLVVGKTILDLFLHLREHARPVIALGGGEPAGPVVGSA